MKALIFVIKILTIGTAGAVLVGCGGSRSAIVPTSLIVTDARSSRGTAAAGGAFSGAYSGGYTLVCRLSLSQFKFLGTGSASFIHASSEQGKLREANGGCPNATWTGTATLTSSRHASDTISVSLKTKQESSFPCSISGCSFSVTGGTGKFMNAAGSGTLIMKKLGSHSYSDTWSGSITY